MIIEAEGKIKITKTRWNVIIEIEGMDKYIASADAYYTGLSGIWFGTEEEHNEQWEEQFSDIDPSRSPF